MNVSTVLIKHRNTSRMLYTEELQTIKELIAVLKPIEAASSEICGDQYVTSTTVIPVVNCLEKNILFSFCY